MSKTENVTEINTDDKGVTRGILNGEKVVQIECAAGHSYWRKSQRGRRPEFCPEHTPVEEPKATDAIVTVDEDGEEIVEIPSSFTGPTEAEKLIYALITDKFEKQKLDYYDRELAKNITPRVEESDEDMQYVAPSHLNTRSRVTYLKQERAEFLRRAARFSGRKTVTPAVEETEEVAA